jgi:hypothetical protein
MLKYFRIAVTALSLTACVLLIALWVRSYWWQDQYVLGLTKTQFIHGESARGWISFRSHWVSLYDPYFAWMKFEWRGWRFNSFSIDEWDGSLLPNPAWRWHLRPGTTQSHFTATFPYWLPILVTAALAAVPLLPWSKRFSLRTLLIATTLVAVALGTIIYLAR